MKMIKRGLVLFSLLCCFSASVRAELSTTQWWGTYTYNQTLNEEWRISARLGLRYYSFDQQFYRPDFCPHVQFSPGARLKYLGGARFLHWNTSSRDGVLEFRPWLGALYTHTLPDPLSFSHLARWEHRFWGSRISDYSSRLRYRLKFGATLYKKEEKSLQLAFAPEMFWALGAYDQAIYTNTRWGMPVAYRPSKKFVFEVAPFLQTNHNGLTTLLDDRFWVLQFNVKTFL